MSNTTSKVITTKAGEALIAKMQAENKVLVIDKFVFANVGNRPDFPQREDTVPTADVVYESAVHEQGRLTENSVIYSTTLASDVGPFTFNWSGLYCTEHNTLVAINYPPAIDKTVDGPGVTGNTLVRSFVLEYKGIAETTNITVDPESWQYNAHKRMGKMDNDTSQAIIDQNGKDWFIDDGFIVTPQSTAYNIKAGAGYVSGNRIQLDFDRIVQVPNKPSFIYVDAWREGTPTGEWLTKFNFVVSADEKDDYTDAQGVKHFVCKIAQVLADGSVSDLRAEGKSATKSWVSSVDRMQTDMLTGNGGVISGTVDELQIKLITTQTNIQLMGWPSVETSTLFTIVTCPKSGSKIISINPEGLTVSFSDGTVSNLRMTVKSTLTINSMDYGLVGDGDLLTGEGTNDRNAFQRMLDDTRKGTTIEIGNAVMSKQTFIVDGDLDIYGKEGVSIRPIGRVEILHKNGRLRAERCPRFQFGPNLVMRGLEKDIFDARQGEDKNTYKNSLYTNGGAGTGLQLVLCPNSTVNENEWAYFITAITSDGSYISWFNMNKFSHNRVSIHPIIKTAFPDGVKANDHQNIHQNVFGNHYEGHCISTQYFSNDNADDVPTLVEEFASNTISIGIGNQFETYSGSGLSVSEHPYDIYLKKSDSTKINGPVMVNGGGVYLEGDRVDVKGLKQYDIGTRELVTVKGSGDISDCEQYFSKNSGGDDFETAAGKIGFGIKDGQIQVQSNTSFAGNGIYALNAGNSELKDNTLNASDQYCIANVGGKILSTNNVLKAHDTAKFYRLDLGEGGFVQSVRNKYNSRDVVELTQGYSPNKIVFLEDNINAPEITVPGNNEIRASSKTVVVTQADNAIINVYMPEDALDMPFDEFTAFFRTGAEVRTTGNIITSTGGIINIQMNTIAKFIRVSASEWVLDY